MSPDTVVEREL